MKIRNFIKKNEQKDLQQLEDFVKVSDGKSSHVLDLLASIRARDDCLNLLCTKFESNELDFIDFIKMSRKLE